MRLPNAEHEAHPWVIAQVAPDFKHIDVWRCRGENLSCGQMGVCIKPRGSFGATYTSLTGPFRHLIAYPAFMRQIERASQARPGQHHVPDADSARAP